MLHAYEWYSVHVRWLRKIYCVELMITMIMVVVLMTLNDKRQTTTCMVNGLKRLRNSKFSTVIVSSIYCLTLYHTFRIVRLCQYNKNRSLSLDIKVQLLESLHRKICVDFASKTGTNGIHKSVSFKKPQ